jgi:Na+/proline symporter
VTVPLIITAVIVAAAIVIGFASRGRTRMDLEQWTVAGRRYGGLLLWVLGAGEIYTTFTFLGAAGYGYAKGGPVFYILVLPAAPPVAVREAARAVHPGRLLHQPVRQQVARCAGRGHRRDLRRPLRHAAA